MTRRMQRYDVPEWRPWLMIASFGIVILLPGAVCQVTQLVVSIRNRNDLRDETGDPWNGRSLEWATASPPPAFNFAVLPNVQGEEPYWTIKQRAIETQQLAAEPDLPADRDAAQQPDRLHYRVLLDADGLCPDLAYLVACRRGSFRRLRRLRLVRMARPDEYVIPAEEVAVIDRDRRRARQAWLDARARVGEPA